MDDFSFFCGFMAGVGAGGISACLFISMATGIPIWPM